MDETHPPNVLSDPDKEGPHTDQLSPVLVGLDAGHDGGEVLDQLPQGLVPPPAHHLHVVIALLEEERVITEEVHLGVRLGLGVLPLEEVSVGVSLDADVPAPLQLVGRRPAGEHGGFVHKGQVLIQIIIEKMRTGVKVLRLAELEAEARVKVAALKSPAQTPGIILPELLGCDLSLLISQVPGCLTLTVCLDDIVCLLNIESDSFARLEDDSLICLNDCI